EVGTDRRDLNRVVLDVFRAFASREVRHAAVRIADRRFAVQPRGEVRGRLEVVRKAVFLVLLETANDVVRTERLRAEEVRRLGSGLGVVAALVVAVAEEVRRVGNTTERR